MSSLSQQLKSIGVADQRQKSLAKSQRFRASFLFDAKQAADQDLDTIYTIGIAGLAELRELDERFAAYERTLFSESMKGVDRLLQTKQENSKLDESIETFLRQLSPHFLLNPAGKALEWLIRRFRIHEFNVDAVMKCILPYHETKQFVTMVNLLQIEEGSLWSFLLPLKKSKHPLERGNLVQRLVKDRALLEFVCELVSTASSKRLSFRTLFAFHASTLVAYIQAVPKVTDDILTTILPHLLHGLKSKTEFQLASYIVLSQVCVRATLSNEAATAILVTATQHAAAEHIIQLLLFLVHVCQTQESLDAFPARAAARLVKVQGLPEMLGEICRKYQSDRFMALFVSSLIQEKARDNSKILDAILQRQDTTQDFFQKLVDNPETKERLSVMVPSLIFQNEKVDAASEDEAEEDSRLKVRVTDVKSIQKIADTLLTSATMETEVSQLLAAVNSTEYSERVTAVFVLTRLIWNLEGDKQNAVVAPFLTALFTRLRDVNEGVKLQEGGLPPDNAFKRPIDTERLFMFGVLGVLQGLKAPKAPMAWLNEAGESAEVVAYKKTVARLYCFLASGSHFASCEEKIQRLLEKHIGENVIEFLAKFWTDDVIQTPVLVQARSLQIANVFFAAHAEQNSTLDFQIVIPSLLLALGSPSKPVRQAAVTCLQTLSKLYSNFKLPTETSRKRKATPSVPIFKLDAFYGLSASEELQYLPAGVVAEFVRVILQAKEEFLTSGDYVSQFLGQSLNKESNDTRATVSKKETLLSFIGSHVLAFHKPVAQLRLVQLTACVRSPMKLTILLPLMQKSRRETELMIALVKCFTPATASLLDGKNTAYMKVFLGLLRGSGEGGENENAVRRAALAQITPALFEALSPAKQAELFAELVELATNAEQEIVKAVKGVLKQLPIHAQLVAGELATVQEALVELVKVEVIKKTRRTTPDNEALQPLYRLITLLEMLEYKPVREDVILVPALFDLLATIFNGEWQDTPVSLEYVNQLVMSSLTSILRECESVEENAIRVDLLVQCIRATGNPQTHNQALLLMAAIAPRFPERVLHNIMPVFTFMGANVLRQDDNYSFHVIQQTLEKVIPPLVASHRRAAEKKDDHFVPQVKPIIKVFVDALFHIPKHRRLRLFTILIQTLGETEFLYAVLTLLLEKYTEKLQKGHNSEAESLCEFCLTVSNQFAPLSQMKSLISLFESLLKLPNEKLVEQEKKTRGKKNAARTMEMEVETAETFFDLAEHSDKQLRQFKLATLNFAGQLLVNKAFTSKSAHTSIEEGDALYLRMSELLLQLIAYFGQHHKAYAARDNSVPPVVKFWRGIVKVAHDVLDKVNGMLSLPVFVRIMKELFHHNEFSVRRKAMVLFNEKVASTRSHAGEQDQALFIEMAKELGDILGKASDSQDETEVVGKQTALVCLTTLANRFGKTAPKAFADTMPQLLATMQHPSAQVCVSSLVCLGTMCQELGPHAVPYLPQFMPIILGIVEETLKSTQGEEGERSTVVLQLSGTVALETVVRCLPHFVSPYLTRILGIALHPKLMGYEGNDGKKQQAEERARQMLSLMATKVPPRVFLPPLLACFNQLTDHELPLLTMLDTLTEAVVAMPRDAIAAHQAVLFKHLLSMFDLRRAKPNLAYIDKAEEHTLGAFLELVMKLNESRFKPMFLKLVDWATVSVEGPEDSNARLTVFYHVLDGLLNKLKSIVAPYFGYVIDHCIGLLNAYAQEKRDASEPLWAFVIEALHKSLLYDNDGFWQDKLDALIGPLVDQLSITCPPALVTCLGQLAVTAGNEAHWKPLSHRVLMKTRHDSAEVRLGALKVVEEFYSRLGEEFLILLPETIPFLAELMEDEDDRVEKQTQEVVRLIEQYLGESLDKYFH
ncbi:uncharacterized protein VTP21DRAFT_2850 [Calcarisporiella thermophila]|uniref:uncharacterized protein n=1 Tax=Calcarisporiella thermophila TaxID=911321 RepID=UPI0037449AA9